MTRNAEALVIGGGPVGLFAALALLERGVSVQVLDAAGERAMRGYACGLHPETLRLLDGVGLAPALLEAGHRVDRLVVRRGQAVLGRADLAAMPSAYPFLLSLRQSELEELLEEALARRGAGVLRHHAVTQLYSRHGCVHVAGHHDRDPRARGPNEDIAVEPIEREVDFVIGADGYFSVCRRALGVEFATVQPTRAFAVCEFMADLRGWEREAIIVPTPDAVSAFWPLGPNLGRWTFQVYNRLDATPTLDDLHALLRERAPWFTPNPEQLCWSAVAPFEQRLARRFGQGRVWLAGDAAHSASPIGFHSMNRGFCEAEALAGLIASALYDEDHRPSAFERFEGAQRAEWQRLFGLEPATPDAGWPGAELSPCLPATGQDLAVLTRQLRLSAGNVG